jgi:nitrous oxidase accessory protein
VRRPPLVLAAALAAVVATGAATSHAAPAPFDLRAAVAAARAGDTVPVPPGVYPGPLVLDKALVLVGTGMPIIDGGGVGSVVSITAPDVTLRGFVVRSSGTSLDREDSGIVVTAPRATLEGNHVEDALFGIYLKQAPGSVLRGNEVRAKALDQARMGDGIKLWYSGDSVIEGNHVAGSRDVIVWFSDRTTTRGNVIEHSRYGLHYMVSHDQVVEDNILRHNSVGIYLMYGRNLQLRRNLMLDNRGPSGYGLGIKDIDSLTAEGNRMVGNRIGLYFDNELHGKTVDLRFVRNLVAYNELGIDFLPSVSGAVFDHNAFVDNGDQVIISGGGELKGNTWSTDAGGNYWSDYAGFDAGGDGVGDLPYVAQGLFEDLLAAYPGLRIFQLSPATQALDLAARAFPVFQPRAKVTDAHPLMAPPDLPAVPGLPAPPRAANLAVAAGLLALASAILTAGVLPGRADRHAVLARPAGQPSASAP